MGKARADSRYSAIGLINLDEKQTGAPSAGNPHAGCEVAGAGIRLTVQILRHFQRKREATDRLNLRGNGASPRPYRWRRVVKRDSARRCPGLRGWLPRAHHVLGDAGLADVDAQLKQFTVDAWCTPGGILSAHPADQVSNFTADARTSGC